MDSPNAIERMISGAHDSSSLASGDLPLQVIEEILEGAVGKSLTFFRERHEQGRLAQGLIAPDAMNELIKPFMLAADIFAAVFALEPSRLDRVPVLVREDHAKVGCLCPKNFAGFGALQTVSAICPAQHPQFC